MNALWGFTCNMRKSHTWNGEQGLPVCTTRMPRRAASTIETLLSFFMKLGHQATGSQGMMTDYTLLNSIHVAFQASTTCKRTPPIL